MRVPILCLCILLPGLSFAETVSIRSGEHETYTRLVLTMPEGTGWEIGATDTGYLAQFGSPVNEISVDGVFERIPRDRLAGLRSTEAQLDLQVSCECHLDAFLFRPDMLVIDIIDGPAPDDSPYEIPVTTRGVAPPEVIEITSAEAQPLNNSDTLASEPSGPAQIELPLFIDEPPWTESLAAVSPSFARQTARDPNLVEAERAILESFARAATQGVFDFPARPLPTPLDEGADPTANLIAPMTDPMDGVPIPLIAADPAGPGLVLRTGIDRGATDEGADNSQPESCPDGINHDLNTWGEAGAFATLIPALRLAAADEIGNPDPEGVLRLARAYLYYGFGLEARRALEARGIYDDQAAFLTALSYLVDGDAVAVETLLPYRACGDMMEAWIALASGRLDTSDQRIKSAVLMSARALPDPLRGHLGIRLAQIFADAGDLHNAQEILSGSMAAITGEDRDLNLTAADLAGRTQGAEAEIAQLDQLIERDPRAAPEDMVRLLEVARGAEAPIDTDILEIAETMRFEANGTAPTADLVEAEVMFQLDMGNYAAAFDLLDGDIGPMTEERQASLRSSAMIVLTERADDAAFLEFAFSDEVVHANHEAEHAIATRLLKLEFPEQALVLISAPITGPLQDERLALQSRATESLAALNAQEDQANGPAPRVTVSDATAQAIETERPEQLTVGDDTGPLVGAWRSGEWAVLEQSADPLLSRASRALLTETLPPGDETPLADTRELLDESRAARDLADGLLDRFTIDDPIGPAQP